MAQVGDVIGRQGQLELSSNIEGCYIELVFDGFYIDFQEVDQEGLIKLRKIYQEKILVHLKNIAFYLPELLCIAMGCDRK